MKKKLVRVMVSSIATVLMVMASIWAAGACVGGYYQPEMPKK